MDVVVDDTCSFPSLLFLLKLVLVEGIGVPYPTDKALCHMPVESLNPWPPSKIRRQFDTYNHEGKLDTGILGLKKHWSKLH